MIAEKSAISKEIMEGIEMLNRTNNNRKNNSGQETKKQRRNCVASCMAGSLDHRWNQILPDLILFLDRLEALGFGVINDKVIVADGNNVQFVS